MKRARMAPTKNMNTMRIALSSTPETYPLCTAANRAESHGLSVDERSSQSAPGDRARGDADPHIAGAGGPRHDAGRRPQGNQFGRRHYCLRPPANEDTPTRAPLLVDGVDLEGNLRWLR